MIGTTGSTIRRLGRLALAGLVLTCSSAGPALAASFDRAAWIADFEQLKAAITRRSPNLEWAAERGLDLAAVERRARERLAEATDDAAARSALDRFVRNFGDGHMELSWPAVASLPVIAAPVIAAPDVATCTTLGYRDDADDGAIATTMPGYRPVGLAGGDTRAGTADVGERSVAVLRIPLFAPSAAICARVLIERGVAPDATCDVACADAVSRRADALFLDEIAGRPRLLARTPARVLILDVAGNGGGNDTAIAIARMIAGADVPTPRMVFARTPERLQDLVEDEAELRRGLAAASPARRAVLAAMIETHAAARMQAARPCDLSPLWRNARTGCSNLVTGGFHAGGLAPLEVARGVPSGIWDEMISSTARFSYQPGLWSRPLVVLVDANSASATELLAAMLQDARGAVIVGAPTFGAGCGWTLPRQDIVLARSGGLLSMPDCARLRRDGRNEIDGIEPDVLVGFRRYDSPGQRRQRLLERLPAALGAAVRLAAPKSATADIVPVLHARDMLNE